MWFFVREFGVQARVLANLAPADVSGEKRWSCFIWHEASMGSLIVVATGRWRDRLRLVCRGNRQTMIVPQLHYIQKCPDYLTSE